MLALRTFLLCFLLPLCLSGRAQDTAFKPFSHYQVRMKQFAKQQKIGTSDIVMLGNSLTEYAGDWNKLLKTQHIRNRGIAGDVAMGIYQRLNTILPYRPKAIFLMVGTNDVSHNLSPSQVFGLCKKVIDKVRQDAPQTQLFVQSLLPFNESFGRWKLLEGKSAHIPRINALLEKYCHENNIPFINLYPQFIRKGTDELRRELTTDGLHLSPIGYKRWAFELCRYIKALDAQQ